MMVCSVKLTVPDLTEAKFWPFCGGRNWGWKAEEFLLPQEKVGFTQFYPFIQPASPQKLPNPLAGACTKTWNWNGWVLPKPSSLRNDKS